MVDRLVEVRHLLGRAHVVYVIAIVLLIFIINSTSTNVGSSAHEVVGMLVTHGEEVGYLHAVSALEERGDSKKERRGV